MDWKLQVTALARILIAATLGAALGWNRERGGHDAGIRTCAAVALGACVFGLVSAFGASVPDTTRIAAQVVSGIGFVGGGVILRDQGKVKGLTTAAVVWVTAAAGLATAYGLYILSIGSTLILLLVLRIPHTRRRAAPVTNETPVVTGWGRPEEDEEE